jgi:hypothetical protein
MLHVNFLVISYLILKSIRQINITTQILDKLKHINITILINK